MTAIRVASFNIRNGRAFDGWNSWPFRRGATLEAIRSLDADVIGLQEAFGFQLRWLVDRLPDYDAIGRGRTDGRRGEHTPLLLRRGAVEVVDHRTRWFGRAPERPGERLPGSRFPRTTTTATVQLGGGVHVRCTCTHLDESSAERRRQSVAQLLEWLEPDPVPDIVLGDFNAVPGDPLFSLFAEASYRAALGPDAGGSNHDFTGCTDGRRLDHILVGPAVEVVRAAVVYPRPGGRLPSDHWPVVADVDVTVPPAKS